VAAAIASLSSAGIASAYCRTTTCDPSRQDCSPPDGEECTAIGVPLFWPNECVGYSLQQDASPDIPYDTFAEITQRAFQSWLGVDCGGGQGPSISVHDLGPVPCDAAEYNQYTGNANIIMFRSVTWPYTSATHTLAITTVTFNTDNAQIYDVDIEVNAAGIQLTTGDDNVQYDLEAILAHEIGHYFGLAHSADSTATMFAKYRRGTVDLRSPEPDDVAGICEAYAPGRAAGACDPTPRHGMKSTCGDGSPPETGGCGLRMAPGGLSSQHAGWAGVCVLALLLGRQRHPNAKARKSDRT